MTMSKQKQIEKAYALAQERYAELGVDTEKALKILEKTPVSVQCWQADDVVGFEQAGGGASGGTLCTGNYPGRARNADELRADFDEFLDLMPGTLRMNLHAIYLESEKSVERNKIKPEHFANWIAWAKERKIGLDFNPTFFSHPKAADGLTLSHPDKGIRDFWIEHGIACRKISEAMGKELKSCCMMNIWLRMASRILRWIATGQENALRILWIKCWQKRSIRNICAIAWKANFSGSAWNPVPSAAMNFMWATA